MSSPSPPILDNPTKETHTDMPFSVFKAIEDYRKDDILVAYEAHSCLENIRLIGRQLRIIGAVDSGTTEFINLLASQSDNQARVDNPSEIQAIRLENHPSLHNRIVLLQTPCFDGTTQGEQEILKRIQRWMAEMYPKDSVNLRGLFYMHSTSGARAASPLSNIEHYRRICGDPSMKRVRLVALTRFEMGGDDAERERLVKRVRDSMRDFWNGFETLGSKVHTLEGNNSEGAWTIVDQLVADGSEAEHDALNQAFAAIEKELNKTEPGKTLLELMKKSLSQLRSKQDDPKELAIQYMRTRDQMVTKIIPAIRDKLKIRVGERFTAFFTRMVSQLAIRCVRKCVYAYRLALLTLPVGAVAPSTYAFNFRIEPETDGSPLTRN